MLPPRLEYTVVVGAKPKGGLGNEWAAYKTFASVMVASQHLTLVGRRALYNELTTAKITPGQDLECFSQ